MATPKHSVSLSVQASIVETQFMPLSGNADENWLADRHSDVFKNTGTAPRNTLQLTNCMKPLTWRREGLDTASFRKGCGRLARKRKTQSRKLTSISPSLASSPFSLRGAFCACFCLLPCRGQKVYSCSMSRNGTPAAWQPRFPPKLKFAIRMSLVSCQSAVSLSAYFLSDFHRRCAHPGLSGRNSNEATTRCCSTTDMHTHTLSPTCTAKHTRTQLHPDHEFVKSFDSRFFAVGSASLCRFGWMATEASRSFNRITPDQMRIQQPLSSLNAMSFVTQQTYTPWSNLHPLLLFLWLKPKGHVARVLGLYPQGVIFPPPLSYPFASNKHKETLCF